MKRHHPTRRPVLKGRSQAKAGMTIGELAERTGVPDSTIRYYERQHLLRPAGRTTGNYRHYPQEAIDRLRFIRAAQASGFSLTDIGTLIGFQDGIAPCEDVQPIIAARLEDVSRQMQELRHVYEVLEAFSRTCVRTPHGDACPVLIELTRRTPK